MPPLNNPRWERFAQDIALGTPASKAYVGAGYKDSDASACKLQRKLRPRIEELQRPVAAKMQVTLESLTEKYFRAHDAAYELGQPGVAVRALDSLGKLYGLFIERHEHGGVGDFERMSDDALRNLARKALIIEGKVNKPEPGNNDGS